MLFTVHNQNWWTLERSTMSYGLGQTAHSFETVMHFREHGDPAGAWIEGSNDWGQDSRPVWRATRMNVLLK